MPASSPVEGFAAVLHAEQVFLGPPGVFFAAGAVGGERTSRLLSRSKRVGQPVVAQVFQSATVNSRLVRPGCPETKTSSLSAAPAVLHFR